MHKKVCILTEAGKGIGFGHIMRCMAIADCFSVLKHDVEILLHINGSFQSDRKYIRYVNWLHKEVLSDMGDHLKNAIAIVDSYLADAEFFTFLKTLSVTVVVLDDYNRMHYPDIDLLINPDIFGDKIDYSNQQAKVFGGKDYIIIRDAFLKYRDRYRVKEDIKTLGITVGGSDLRNLLPEICRKFEHDQRFDKIIVFAGNDINKAELEKTFSISGFEFHGYLDADLMAVNLLKCDMVISAAGQTLNELAYLGIPTAAICIDEDQVFNMEGYYDIKFIHHKISWDQHDYLEKIDLSFQYLSGKEIRQRVHKIGLETVTGEGTGNIIKAISKID